MLHNLVERVMSSVVFALHISLFVYPSVVSSFYVLKVPVLALYKVVFAAELS